MRRKKFFPKKKKTVISDRQMRRRLDGQKRHNDREGGILLRQASSEVRRKGTGLHRMCGSNLWQPGLSGGGQGRLHAGNIGDESLSDDKKRPFHREKQQI